VSSLRTNEVVSITWSAWSRAWNPLPRRMRCEAPEEEPQHDGEQRKRDHRLEEREASWARGALMAASRGRGSQAHLAVPPVGRRPAHARLDAQQAHGQLVLALRAAAASSWRSS